MLIFRLLSLDDNGARKSVVVEEESVNTTVGNLLETACRYTLCYESIVNNLCTLL